MFLFDLLPWSHENWLRERSRKSLRLAFRLCCERKVMGDTCRLKFPLLTIIRMLMENGGKIKHLVLGSIFGKFWFPKIRQGKWVVHPDCQLRLCPNFFWLINLSGCIGFDWKAWLTEIFLFAWLQHKMEELSDQLAKKKNQISNMMERTSEVRRMKEDLKQSLSIVWWLFDILRPEFLKYFAFWILKVVMNLPKCLHYYALLVIKGLKCSFCSFLPLFLEF